MKVEKKYIALVILFFTALISMSYMVFQSLQVPVENPKKESSLPPLSAEDKVYAVEILSKEPQPLSSADMAEAAKLLSHGGSLPPLSPAETAAAKKILGK